MSTPGTGPQVAGDARRLDQSLMSGLAWTGSAKWVTQVISWASTLIVFRLLTPSDYGVTGMAGVYLGLVQLISEFGLGTAIQQQDLDRGQLAKLHGLSVLLGAALLAVSLALAAPIAWFFHEPRVQLVLAALATLYVVTGIQVVPRALLQRELRFRALAIVESTEALVQIAATLALALAGLHYWAIVLGNLVSKLVSTVMVLVLRPHPMAWPARLAELRASLQFGWQVVVSRVAWYGYSNADFVVIGRMLGGVALGAYTFGWNIASIPADKLNAVMNRVTIPIFAAVQHDKAAVARYVVRLSEGLAFLVLPASIGMAAVAPEFVRVVLGPRWLAATVPLALLSLHVTFRCINSVFSCALFGLGETRQSVRVSVALLVVMPILFAIGATGWGIEGVALMWLIGHPIVSFPMLVTFTARRTDMRLADLGRALWPPLAASIVMGLVVLGAKQLLPAGAPPAVRLSVGVLGGLVTYPLLLWGFFRDRVAEGWAAIRRLRDPAAAVPAA